MGPARNNDPILRKRFLHRQSVSPRTDLCESCFAPPLSFGREWRKNDKFCYLCRLYEGIAQKDLCFARRRRPGSFVARRVVGVQPPAGRVFRTGQRRSVLPYVR